MLGGLGAGRVRGRGRLVLCRLFRGLLLGGRAGVDGGVSVAFLGRENEV